ncbi:MAG: hemerythrin domain-containing protein [Proteobacteria bacterium]|nr:hemerythrin domain-containing protein [Pseudomonadota bacterium]
MSSLAEYMSTDHKACDAAFALAEEAALDNHWEQAQTAFNAFSDNTGRHFRMEEEALFPAMLNAGGPAGPVQMMLMEHAQMNDLIEQMAVALANKNAKTYGGLSETLLIVMQQHNLKEEQILYPIADRVLAAERESLLTRLKAI